MTCSSSLPCTLARAQHARTVRRVRARTERLSPSDQRRNDAAAGGGRLLRRAAVAAQASGERAVESAVAEEFEPRID
jgi:hypothetical protein